MYLSVNLNYFFSYDVVIEGIGYFDFDDIARFVFHVCVDDNIIIDLGRIISRSSQISAVVVFLIDDDFERMADLVLIRLEGDLELPHHDGIEPFLLEILGPLTEVDIAYPTPGERAALWIDLAKKHPSIRGVNRISLVRFSANLARFDICMAARDAIEDAYKQGLRAGKYTPVHPYDLFEKLAAYQPLDSREYAELEEAMIRDFSRGLNSDDPLFEGR